MSYHVAMAHPCRQIATVGDDSSVATSGPFFLPDIFEQDLGPLPNFAALVVDPRIVGCILKATQGVTYAPPWFTTNWPRVRAIGGDRYGTSWFRGCYAFGVPTASGDVQADYLLSFVERSGGWSDGDMVPAWDLEGSAWTSNQQIIDVSSAFSARIKSQLGKTPLLYAGSLIRDRGITNDMGFKKLWSPQVNMAAADWALSDYALWQYAGDGGRGYDLRANLPQAGSANFPLSIAGWGGTDMNVVMDDGMPATSIEAVKSILTGKDGLQWPLMIGAGLLGLGMWLSKLI